MKPLRACFFSTDARDYLENQQYLLQDVRILQGLGFHVRVESRFQDIPWNCDLYYSWWATGSALPLIVSRLRGKPIIVVAGGNEVMSYRDSISGRAAGYLAYPPHKKLAARASLRFADQVFVVSEFMLEDVVALGARSPVVAYNTVDPNVFSEVRGIERRVVTSVFNFDSIAYSIKRGDIFIRSIPKVLAVIPGAQFRIIGRPGDMLPDALDLIDRLGVRSSVEILGLVKNSEIPRLFSEASVYVQISDTETFGLSIVEAMACGAPVVVSSRGAIPEVVGECGVYVDQNSPESVANGIVSVLDRDPLERTALVRKARQRVESLFAFGERERRVRAAIRGLLRGDPRLSDSS